MGSKGRINKLFAMLAVASLSATLAMASTFVSGDISGTWKKAGSPYVATGDCTVQPGQTLIIEPGVEVIIGQGLKIDVYGDMVAEGTAAEKIIFRGGNSTLFWDKITIHYTSSSISFFSHCWFSEATTALSLSMIGGDTGSITMETKIIYSVFDNCQDTCIYAYCHGDVVSYPGGSTAYYPILSPVIRNCIFIESERAISVMVDGERPLHYSPVGGRFDAIIANCLFRSIADKAINFSVGSHPGTSYPELENCVLQDCGIAAQNNSLTYFNDTVAYNCFFSNTTDFVGYPVGVHGVIAMNNANGTPCDLLYNIFEDPDFSDTNTFELAATSPCIDAGNPDGEYLDTNFPPSQETPVNDMGIFGGPYAGYSLANGYNGVTNFALSTQTYIGVTVNPSAAGTYRLDYTEDLTSDSWSQVTNINLLSTPWTYIDMETHSVSQRFFRAVLLP